MTTADYLEQLQDDLATINTTLELPAGTNFTDIAEAVENGDIINNNGGSSEIKIEKDVNFYDYDGTLVESYSKNEFLNLSSLPDNPTHTGLTAQGWNWSLQDAQNYVTANDKLDVGQMYKTSDDKTHIIVDITNTHMEYYVGIGFGGTATIDWGDGTTTSFSGSNMNYVYNAGPHKYAAPGVYTIKIDFQYYYNILGGTYCANLFWANISGNENNNHALNCVKEIRLAKWCSLKSAGLYYMRNLKAISIPQEVTSIAANCFAYCQCLKHINIPNQCTSIGNYAFQFCQSLEHICLAKSITSMGYNVLYQCGLKRINISINGSVSTFFCNSCRSLKEVIVPSTVSLLDAYAFAECQSLEELDLSKMSINITSYFCKNCYSLRKVKLPTTATTIPAYAFEQCKALSDIEIPSTVTSLDTQCFIGCGGLSQIKFPPNLASIGNSAFGICNSMIVYDFSDCTSVPTMTNTGSIYVDTNYTRKIIVPDALYNSWITAQYWSNYASYIISKSDWDALNT